MILDIFQSEADVALAAGAIVLGGFLRGFVGFGSALVVIPLLSLAIGPRAAIPLHALLEVVAVVQLMPAAVREADRTLVLPVVAALVVALPLGAWVLVTSDPKVIQVAISIVVLAMVALIASKWRLGTAPGPRLSLLAGGISGFVQGSVGVGGPPLVALALSKADPPDTTRGNIVALLAAIVIIAWPTLWAYGLFTRDIIAATLAGIPLYVGAIWLGSRVFHGGGRGIHRTASLWLLVAIALATLVKALT